MHPTLVDFHTGHHEWYEKQGKYLAKKNTFNDFVDCALYLKEKGISGDMSCEGRSAGQCINQIVEARLRSC